VVDVRNFILKNIILFIIFFTKIVIADLLSELDREQKEIQVDFFKLKNELLEPGLLKTAIAEKKSLIVISQIESYKKFFKKYDDFNLKKIDFIQEFLLKNAHEVVQQELEFSGKLSKNSKKWFKTLIERHHQYQKEKNRFGTDLDFYRTKINFLATYGNFVNSIRTAQGEHPWRKFGGGKILPFIDSPRDFFKVSDKFFNLIWNSYFRARTGIPDRAPIVDALSEIQGRFSKMRNLKTHWEGIENLQDTSHDGQTLNLFLINHANSYFDTTVQQTFPLKNISAMGNVDIIFPKFLSKQMIRSDHMITIGHGDTLSKTINLIKKKQLNKFFLSIEGFTGTGLYEMRPVIPLFAESLYAMIERGMKVKLYPIAFPDNFKLMNDWRAPIEGNVVSKGVLRPLIDTETCLDLFELTKSKESISQIIRWDWFLTLNNSDDLVLSMPYPSVILNLIEEMTWGNK